MSFLVLCSVIWECGRRSEVLMLLMISYFNALLILIVYDVVKEEIASDLSSTTQESFCRSFCYEL